MELDVVDVKMESTLLIIKRIVVFVHLTVPLVLPPLETVCHVMLIFIGNFLQVQIIIARIVLLNALALILNVQDAFYLKTTLKMMQIL